MENILKSLHFFELLVIIYPPLAMPVLFELSRSRIVHEIYLIQWKDMRIQFFFLLIAALSIFEGNFFYIRFYILLGPICLAISAWSSSSILLFIKIIFQWNFQLIQTHLLNLWYIYTILNYYNIEVHMKHGREFILWYTCSCLYQSLSY